MGRSKVILFPSESCVNCDKCIYDKRTGKDICIVNFETIEANKHKQCKRYSDTNKKAWRKKV
jgi:hypothetical protein